jgi:hypothetical protein
MRDLAARHGRRLCLAALLALPFAAAAQPVRVERIEESQFQAGAGRITFSEVPYNTTNPVYPPDRYGAPATAPTVSFAGHFLGRRLGRPDECPPGAALSGCLVGTPRGPLALDPASPRSFTVDDRNERVLSGSPTFNGPVAILFSRDVAAVGLVGGHFDAIGGTAITVYGRDGTVLGRTANTRIGREFLGLATSDLSERIAGLEFHLVGREPAGFGVDNIRFGDSRQVRIPGVQPPAPTPPPRPIMLP